MRLRNSRTISRKFFFSSFTRCLSKYNKNCFLNSYPSCKNNSRMPMCCYGLLQTTMHINESEKQLKSYSTSKLIFFLSYVRMCSDIKRATTTVLIVRVPQIRPICKKEMLLSRLFAMLFPTCETNAKPHHHDTPSPFLIGPFPFRSVSRRSG